MGLWKVRADSQARFLVDRIKNVFYCYGCGRGGDVIRFVELYYDLRFGEAMALLRSSRASESVLKDVVSFYQVQLHRHPEAVAYLQQRGIQQPQVIEDLGIGYAPGGRCLRQWLTTLGYLLGALQRVGLLNAAG